MVELLQVATAREIWESYPRASTESARKNQHKIDPI